ncbi:ScpA family protein [Methylococcus sp. EFPC2]|uniref:segregation and condensation protein A n=1 Tax=Methylococcus sp. EFPC2 TaxID=2812648 RepID=UPI001966EF01|nr:ScpA family protein [Methylococcus sp. EFPC2]QSA98358.1 segregation/condensation protein A [Methylococcus sp. EFPC2]
MNEQVIDLPTPAPIALVHGSPYTALPEDLYIPPDALEVFLETFEGPLDLLLYLIRRQNFDILDIPIAAITKQYIGYIDMMSELRMELAAEYLLMAAILAEIKSRMLLPRPASEEAVEEDPRAELVRRLQEYERYKAAAEGLDRLPRAERDFYELGGVDVSAIEVRKIYPEVDLKELLLAFEDVLRRAERSTHHKIVMEPLSVRERMSQVLEKLRSRPFAAFQDLFLRREGRQGALVSLLAILELSKERLIEIVQDEPLGDLHIKPLRVAGD